MTEDEARKQLGSMTAAATDPSLDSDEIERLLDLARRQDRFLLAPTDDGWEPTFDLDYAAAEGWRWKAGKTTPDYGATLDGAQFARNQRYEHCMRMVKEYSDRIMGSAVTPRDRVGWQRGSVSDQVAND